MKVYETQRLILRWITPDEAGLLLDYLLRNRDFLQEWEPSRDESFFSIESMQGIIQRETAAAQNNTGLSLYIFNKGEYRIIGKAALSNIVYGPFQSSYLGYHLDKDEINQGKMTEALYQLIHIAFSELGLHRIEANIIPRNSASVRVMQKLGFTPEGLSKRYLKIHGVWQDHQHFVLLNEGNLDPARPSEPGEKSLEEKTHTSEDLQGYIYEHIPIIKKNDFNVREFPDWIEVTGRHGDHVNHRNSVFGGSLSTALTVSAWAAVRRMVQNWGHQNAVIVIQSQEVQYLLPVTKDFVSRDTGIDTQQQTKVRHMLEKFGKSKLSLGAEIRHQDESEVRARFQEI
jgi:ribosomal-protein-alanine N-acetyltransferase